VDLETAEDWKSKLNQVVSEYPPENQFNADETGLFYRQMPRKSLFRKRKTVRCKIFQGKIKCSFLFLKSVY
jgi:hypothetical protein